MYILWQDYLFVFVLTIQLKISNRAAWSTPAVDVHHMAELFKERALKQFFDSQC